MRFPGFLGNEGLKERLSRSEGRLSHFYILEGPGGSGKRTLARILAAAMLCREPGERPCGACRDCRRILKGEHPDVITVDSDKATVPIRVIREMQADAYIRPGEAERKIYLIPRAGDMLAPAQNALLKLLEEPPSYCVFLLMTENAERMLPTVRSRAVELTLAPLPDAALLQALRERAPTAEPERLRSAADRSQGYLGRALEQLEAPRTGQDRQLEAVTDALTARDGRKLLEALLPMEKQKRDELQQLLTELERIFLQALDGSGQHGAQIRALSTACGEKSLLRWARAAARGVSMLQANVSAGHTVGYLLTELTEGR